jgi:hypothetical protein
MACTTGLLLTCSLLIGTPTEPARAVDLELVMAVDASHSMSFSGRRFEREGYAQAFRSPDVIAAILSGPRHLVAVTLVEWSGQADQTIVVPWTIIGDRADAEAFAGAIEEAPLVQRRHGLTAVGDALLFSARQILLNDIAGARRVIDISGNGAENEGLPAELARVAVLHEGITINGLPVTFQRTELGLASSTDRHEPSVEDFYRKHVIGGLGSFMIGVSEEGDFVEAIRRKLVQEIANAGSVTKEANLSHVN